MPHGKSPSPLKSSSSVKGYYLKTGDLSYVLQNAPVKTCPQCDMIY